MWVQSLGEEDPLEEGMASHSSILAWRIPWTEEPGRLWSIGSHRVRHNWSHLACCTHHISNQQGLKHYRELVFHLLTIQGRLAVQGRESGSIPLSALPSLAYGLHSKDTLMVLRWLLHLQSSLLHLKQGEEWWKNKGRVSASGISLSIILRSFTDTSPNNPVFISLTNN